MVKWTRQPQEKEGNYEFSGRVLVTHGVFEILAEAEINVIIRDVKQAVVQHTGLDYLQVYQNETGGKIWLMDQLDREMLQSDGYTDQQKREYNYFTILLPEEY